MTQLTKIIIPLFISIFLVGCEKRPQDHFNVKGEIIGFEGENILALRFENGLEIDTIKVSKGKFNYTGKLSKPVMVQLLANVNGSSKKFTELMVENSDIEIIGSLDDFDGVQITGSNSDKILKEYFKEDDLLSDEWNSLKVKYDIALKEKDSIHSDELRIQLNQILLEDRVNLLKRYVSQNKDNEVGALIPNFCTLENTLTQEDYLDMYNSLSDNMKKSEYGQSIKIKSEKN